MTGKSKPQDGDGAFDPAAALDVSRALVPAVQRVNEVRVERGFWPKLRRVAARVPFARELAAVWFCAGDPETPAAAKGMALAALAYFVLPVDAVPDVFVGIGFSDDAAVVAALLSLIGANLKPRHHEAAADALARFAGEE